MSVPGWYDATHENLMMIGDHNARSKNCHDEEQETYPSESKLQRTEYTHERMLVNFGDNSTENAHVSIEKTRSSSQTSQGEEKPQTETICVTDCTTGCPDEVDVNEYVSKWKDSLSSDLSEEYQPNSLIQGTRGGRKRSKETLDGLPNKHDESRTQKTFNPKKQSWSQTFHSDTEVDECLKKKLKSVSSLIYNCSGELELSELEEMLDADLPNEYKKPVPSSFIQQFNEKRKQIGDIVEIEKNIFQDINADNFDLLPEGWIQITHNIGTPVYLDRRCRICTLARPYFLGSGNVYNHLVPLSAIPCLQYRQILEKKSDPIALAKVSQATINDCMRLIGSIRVPKVKIETVGDNQRSQSLDGIKVRDYCQKLFKYKKGFVKRDQNIRNKQHASITENHNFKNRPSLPPGTKLLSFMVFDRDPNGEIVRRRECVMNPSGRSYIAILHEYLQQSLRIQPVYQYKDKDNEYEALVKLKDTVFGRGVGIGKKEAKLLAAKAAVEKLIPELNGKAEEIISVNLQGHNNDESTSDSNNIFDEITITDPRVSDFCSRTTEPSPYAMLQTCLRRNCGTVDIDTDYTVSAKHNKHNQFTMTVGKHTVTVSCRNKREGKQKAAQQILQGLHPQLKTWGSLVRLYGNRSVKNAKEKKLEEQEITQLQTLAKINSPNYAILDKLKMELEKLFEKKKQMKPIGKLIMNDVPTNSGANLNPLNYS